MNDEENVVIRVVYQMFPIFLLNTVSVVFLIPQKWGVALGLALATACEQKCCVLLLGGCSLNNLTCCLPLAVVIMEMCVQIDPC